MKWLPCVKQTNKKGKALAVKALLDGLETWVHVAIAKQHKGTDPSGFAQVPPFALVGLVMWLRGGFLACFGGEVFVSIVVENWATSGTVYGKRRKLPESVSIRRGSGSYSSGSKGKG